MHLLAQHVQEMDQKTNLKQSIIKQKQAGTPKMKAINMRKKCHCNSSTCFHCQCLLHLFNFIFIHMLLKEKKKNYWQRMGSRKNGLPNRIQTHCPPEHLFGTLHYAVELIVNFEGPSLDFQLPDGHCRGTVRVTILTSNMAMKQWHNIRWSGHRVKWRQGHGLFLKTRN